MKSKVRKIAGKFKEPKNVREEHLKELNDLAKSATGTGVAAAGYFNEGERSKRSQESIVDAGLICVWEGASGTSNE